MGADGGNDEEEEEDFDWRSEARIAALEMADEAKRLKTPRLGIDFGNVIAANDEDGLVRRRADGTVDYCAQPCAGALEGVRALVRLFKCEHCFIVSKARSRIAERTLEWLRESDFLKEAGLLGGDGHIFFVSGRIDKRPIVEALGITHFIDDRMSVLRSLSSRCVQRVLVCGPWVTHDDRHDRGDRSGKSMPGKVVAQSWPEVVGAVRKWFKTRNAAGKAAQAGAGSPTSAAKALLASVAAPDMASRIGAGAYLPGGEGIPGGRLPEGHTVGSISVVPQLEGAPIPERCAWLERDLEQLRAYAFRLYQAVSRLEGDSRNLDAQLSSSEAESVSLLTRISELQALEGPWKSTKLEAETAAPPVPATPAKALLQVPSPMAAALPGETPGPSPWRAPLTPACAPPAYPAPVAALDFGEAPAAPPAAPAVAPGAGPPEFEAAAIPPVPAGTPEGIPADVDALVPPAKGE